MKAKDIVGTRGHSIDRKNVNGNYCKDNCCWATPKVQSNNRRINLVQENPIG